MKSPKTLKELSLCIGEDSVENLQRTHIASRVEIAALLADQNCQSWFLEAALYHRHDTDDEIVKLITSHKNLRYDTLAVIYKFSPNLADGTLAQNRIIAHKEKHGSAECYDTPDITSCVALINRLYMGHLISLRHEWKKACPGVDLKHLLLNRLPLFMLEHYLDKPMIEAIFVQGLRFELLEKCMSRLPVKSLTKIFTRQDVPAGLLAQYSQHPEISVRLAVAGNQNTPLSELQKLAEDINDKVRATALEKLPLTHKAHPIMPFTSCSTSLDDGALIALLRHEQCFEDDLLKIVNFASPLFVCAATVHPSATQLVIDAAFGRPDLPQWSLVGVIGKSSNLVHMAHAASLNNFDLWMALSGNPHLPLDLAITLLQKTNHDRILANLADRFIDNHDFLRAIHERLAKSTSWRKRLKVALDPKATSDDLERVHSIRRDRVAPGGSKGQRYLILERLVSRHPNCPQRLYGFFLAHLPDDLSRNPAYSLSVLETGLPVKPSPYTDELLDKDLDSGDCSELTLNIVLTKHSNNRERLRRIVSTKSGNPNRVRHLAISGEAAMHQRFLRDDTPGYGQYEYRILNVVGSSALKDIIKDRWLIRDTDDGIVIDHNPAKEDTARTVQSETAELSRMELANRVVARCDVEQRMELARQDSLPNELAELFLKDKSPSVRSTAVRHHGPRFPEILQMMLADRAENVFIDVCQELQDLDNQVYLNAPHKERLLAIINDLSKSPYLRADAIKLLDNAEVYSYWLDNGEQEIVGQLIDSMPQSALIDRRLLESKFSIRDREFEKLCSNPNLSLEQTRRILYFKVAELEAIDNKPNMPKYAIKSLRQDAIAELRKICGLLLTNTRHAEAVYELVAVLKKHALPFSGFRSKTRSWTAEQLADFYSRLELKDYVSIFGLPESISSISDQISQLPTLKAEKCLKSLIVNRELAPAVIKQALDLYSDTTKIELALSLINDCPLSESEIEGYLALGDSAVNIALIMRHFLSRDQLIRAINHPNPECGQAALISKYVDSDQLTTRQIQYFASTATLLYYRAEYLNSASTILHQRKIESDNLQPSAASSLLANYAGVGIKKFASKLSQLSNLVPICYMRENQKQFNLIAVGDNNYGIEIDGKQLFFPWSFGELMRNLGLADSTIA